MVNTVKPKAKLTPTKPIPKLMGLSPSKNLADKTALPQPPNTNQKVPINSAANFLLSIIRLLRNAKENCYQGLVQVSPPEVANQIDGDPPIVGEQGKHIWLAGQLELPLSGDLFTDSYFGIPVDSRYD
jgi:hypothetical protein